MEASGTGRGLVRSDMIAWEWQCKLKHNLQFIVATGDRGVPRKEKENLFPPLHQTRKGPGNEVAQWTQPVSGAGTWHLSLSLIVWKRSGDPKTDFLEWNLDKPRVWISWHQCVFFVIPAFIPRKYSNRGLSPTVMTDHFPMTKRHDAFSSHVKVN